MRDFIDNSLMGNNLCFSLYCYLGLFFCFVFDGFVVFDGGDDDFLKRI